VEEDDVEAVFGGTIGMKGVQSEKGSGTV